MVELIVSNVEDDGGVGKVVKSSAKKILILVSGWILILAGIAGLFLPFFQGVLFLFAGLYLLSRESETARSFLDRLKRRYPGLDRRLREVRDKVKNFGRRDRDGN